MGKDGSKWKHGYIPENAAATALKMHRKPGGKTGTAKTGRRKAGVPQMLTDKQKNKQDLSVPKDIARVKGIATKPKKNKSTFTSAQIRRGKG